MAAPTFVISETNGASTGTVTDNVPQIAFSSTDAASTSSLSANNPVNAGSNSFEKYERMKLTGVAPNSVSAFGVYYSATAVTDSAASSSTVSIKYATNATYATPVAAASSVATTNVTSTTASPGTSFTAPSNTLNSYSGYITLQFQSTAGAAGGNVIFPSPFVNFAYTWS